ncbi:MAG: hypothetical protein MRERC_16c008 [Mycoplasmataceae bacterium RC_NB112A]|nr:MAG: hypothetical protein MRERC_16c008 [Mycoplasmataceae bacterium RC_NB112A]
MNSLSASLFRLHSHCQNFIRAKIISRQNFFNRLFFYKNGTNIEIYKKFLVVNLPYN